MHNSGIIDIPPPPRKLSSKWIKYVILLNAKVEVLNTNTKTENSKVQGRGNKIHINTHNNDTQGLVKGTILCFRNPYFYFRHREITSTAS